MNVCSNSFFKTTFSSFNLQEKITLTTQQVAIVKLALAIFAGLATAYLVAKICALSQRLSGEVTVIEKDGTSYSSHIDKVNGQVKVIFTSFWGSGATVEGEFTNGRLNGQGKEIFPDGCIAEMEGEYQNGHLNGPGKITYRNGTIEEGIFKNGTLTSKD